MRCTHYPEGTKTTVSKRLAALEEALGTKLFDRKPHGLALTAAGQEAIEAAEGIAGQIEHPAERVTPAT